MKWKINDEMIAVKQRIGFGWPAYKNNKIALNSKRIPYEIKSSIYNTYVLPVVVYGLVCVNWTLAALQKLEVFQNHVMQFMTNTKLTDNVRIEKLRQITQLPPITAVIKSNRERQYKRWRDNIKT